MIISDLEVGKLILFRWISSNSVCHRGGPVGCPVAKPRGIKLKKVGEKVITITTQRFHYPIVIFKVDN